MRFEDLEVWNKAADLSVGIYQQLQDLRDYGFRDQITRAGLSISSNIAEGFESSFQKETLRYLSVAKASCGELRSQVHIGIRIKYIPEEVGKKWLNEAIEISAMLSGLIKTKRKFLETEG